MVKFHKDTHKYNLEDGTELRSVTSILKQFSEPFDEKGIAIKSSKNKKSKWYGMKPEDIIKVWKSVNESAIDLGNWYHSEREKTLCELSSVEIDGVNCSIAKPMVESGLKISPDQTLEDGWVYPEHMIYMSSVGLCGQSDLVEVVNNRINIIDFKSNREISTQGYKSWDGTTKKLLHPLKHLDDCKMNIYALQLSFYMYMILRHNPQFKPGKLRLHHVIFKEIGRDKFDYPIYDKDQDNGPIVEDIIVYDVPYLKKEVMAILKYLGK